MGRKRVETLLEQCFSKDHKQRVDAIYELREAEAYTAIPTMLELLTSQESIIRSSAAAALGDLGRAELEIVGPALMSLLDDPQVIVRGDAVESLGLLPYLPARKRIEDLLRNDPDDVVRASAAEALGNLGDKRALVVLEDALNDSFEPVRSYAAFSIGQLGDPELVPKFEQYLESEQSPRVKVILLASRYRIGGSDYLAQLLKLLNTPEEEQGIWVMEALQDLIDHNAPLSLATNASEIRRALEAVGERSTLFRTNVENTLIKLSEKLGST